MSARQPQEDRAIIPRREAIAGLATLGMLAAALVGSVAYRMADSRSGANRSVKPTPEATVNLPELPKDLSNSSEFVDSNALEGAKPIPQISDAELFQKDNRLQRATHNSPLSEPNR